MSRVYTPRARPWSRSSRQGPGQVRNERLHLSPSILIIAGLVYNIIGALIISWDAFGIREFAEKLHDRSTGEYRSVSLSYVAMINQFSVFILSNCCWALILVLVANTSVSFAALLFPLGFFAWKLLVRTLGLSRRAVQRLAPKYREGQGCAKLIVIFPLLILWVVAFSAVSLLHIAVEFSIDLPLRFLGEKAIGKALLKLFEHIKWTLDRSDRTYLKAPILLGGAFLIDGFVYQILGAVLILLER